MKNKVVRSQNLDKIRAVHNIYDPKDKPTILMALEEELRVIFTGDKYNSEARARQALRLVQMIIDNIEHIDSKLCLFNQAIDAVYNDKSIKFSKLAIGEGALKSVDIERVYKYYDIVHRLGFFDQVRFMYKAIFSEKDAQDPRVQVYCETAIRYNNTFAIAKLYYRMAVMMRPLKLDEKLVNVINDALASVYPEDKENHQSFVNKITQQGEDCEYHRHLGEVL